MDLDWYKQHRENTFRRKDYLPRRQMLYVKVSKKCVAEVVSLPRRPILCRRDDQNAADVSKIFRRRVQGFRRRVQNILQTRSKYFADTSKDFADASKIFRRRVQGFRRRVQRFHRRRGNAADATSYRGCDMLPHFTVLIPLGSCHQRRYWTYSRTIITPGHVSQFTPVINSVQLLMKRNKLINGRNTELNVSYTCAICRENGCP